MDNAYQTVSNQAKLPKQNRLKLVLIWRVRVVRGCIICFTWQVVYEITCHLCNIYITIRNEIECCQLGIISKINWNMRM